MLDLHFAVALSVFLKHRRGGWRSTRWGHVFCYELDANVLASCRSDRPVPSLPRTRGDLYESHHAHLTAGIETRRRYQAVHL